MTCRLLSTRAPAANLLIRFMVGGVFFTEGIQKFLYPDDLGSGDLFMLPYSTFLLLTGAGHWSIDVRLSRQ